MQGMVPYPGIGMVQVECFDARRIGLLAQFVGWWGGGREGVSLRAICVFLERGLL